MRDASRRSSYRLCFVRRMLSGSIGTTPELPTDGLAALDNEGQNREPTTTSYEARLSRPVRTVSGRGQPGTGTSEQEAATLRQRANEGWESSAAAGVPPCGWPRTGTERDRTGQPTCPDDLAINPLITAP